MKRIFLAITLICSTAVFCADRTNKKAKIVKAVTPNVKKGDPSKPVARYQGFGDMTSEMSLNILSYFVHTTPDRVVDLDDARSLIALKRTSWANYHLVNYQLLFDTKTVAELSPWQYSLIKDGPIKLVNESTIPEQLSTIKTAQNKFALLKVIDALPSDEMKIDACNKLEQAKFIVGKLGSGTLTFPQNHLSYPVMTILEGAIERSNLTLVKAFQQLCNMRFVEKPGIAAKPGDTSTLEQRKLASMATRIYEERLQKHKEVFGPKTAPLFLFADNALTPEQKDIMTKKIDACEILMMIAPSRAKAINQREAKQLTKK